VKALPNDQTGELVALVREGRWAAVVDRALGLAPADIADVLAELDPDARDQLVAGLPPRLAARALALMPATAQTERADTRTAAALMTSRLVAVNELDSIALAVEAVRRQAETVGDLTEVFVVDTALRLTGVLPISQLLIAATTSQVRDGMIPDPVHVSPTDSQEHVARVIARYALTSLPVVDGGGRLIGRITSDVVRAVTVDEVTSDLLRFGGVSAREPVDATWLRLVRSRVPMLYASLVPAFAAAAVVFFFKGAIARIVTLAVWLPVVAAVGGNGGIQSLATAMRRQLLHTGRRERLRSIVWRELAVGSVSGLAIGAVVSGVAVLLGESWKVALVVLIATMANLAMGGVIGAIIPTALKRLGRDPAFASVVLLTAALDAIGVALLLGLAGAILQ